jgi:hypothetical protein
MLNLLLFRRRMSKCWMELRFVCVTHTHTRTFKLESPRNVFGTNAGMAGFIDNTRSCFICANTSADIALSALQPRSSHNSFVPVFVCVCGCVWVWTEKKLYKHCGIYMIVTYKLLKFIWNIFNKTTLIFNVVFVVVSSCLLF